jgi:aspartate/tyrosine/aromatic aminotransferase
MNMTPNHTNSNEFESELTQAIATAQSSPPETASAAPLIAQVLDVAATIRMLRADLDELETDFIRRITAIRKRMGVKV